MSIVRCRISGHKPQIRFYDLPTFLDNEFIRFHKAQVKHFTKILDKYRDKIEYAVYPDYEYDQICLLTLRVSDALIPISYNRRVGKAAIYGTALGAMVSNILSFYGFYDLFLGTVANFFASYAAYMFSKREGNLWKVLAAVSSCAVVIFFIGFLLFHLILNLPLESSLIGISIGSFVSIVLLGMILMVALGRIYR